MNEQLTNVLDKVTDMGARNAANMTQNANAINPNIMGLITDYPPEKIFIMILFSLLGTGYLIYGKKTADYTIILAGISLLLVSYFFSKPLQLALVGTAIAFLPFLLKRL